MFECNHICQCRTSDNIKCRCFIGSQACVLSSGCFYHRVIQRVHIKVYLDKLLQDYHMSYLSICLKSLSEPFLANVIKSLGIAQEKSYNLYKNNLFIFILYCRNILLKKTLKWRIINHFASTDFSSDKQRILVLFENKIQL